ncbi:MAG TPA: SDR family oxidoreductase [Nitrososphaeraceae archaeon]|nr:SDR family oxidoreductase [Nitrososphaeraceae archaeon]
MIQIRKTAIITGGSRGIGKEVAILLAKKGINVVICSRNHNEINRVVDEIKAMYQVSEVLGLKCDISISIEVNSLIKSTIERFGGIDILINNAGIVFVKKLIDTLEEEWDQTINTNLKGAFLCSKAVLPYMIHKKSGVIINVSSGAGKVGFENISAYCASKFGMMGLTESLAWEVANYNMRVMTICPGEVDTKMQESTDQEYYKLNKDKWLEPREVADKIAEMIFNEDYYKNGESIDIYK